ncbi:DENN domain-containing protein 1A isoform X2 [Patella vulgata]|uniref:DENN domain-containing protein 1A isoform X2 n=1 Tax=Patella vulgata TaxID=6465 RepID=UPI00217FC159|nr:DENN domain-containing protein 1A isoform X2 [Patella vulgata]
MGSRLRESPGKLFEVFMEVAKPNGEIEEPFILQQYPEYYKDQEVLKSSPKFAYPCEIDCGAVDHFTFVFTDIDGKFKFGFCRHTPGAPTTLCIVSCLPWFEIFYKLLNMIAEILNRSEMNCAIPLLEATYNHEIPMPKVPVTIVAQQEMLSFSGPDPAQLPSIPASRNLTEYYNAIDTNNMMIIFAHLLNERRVLFTSKKLSRLTSCIHAASALLYPMCWQHLFIPLLPAHGNLIEYVSAPMPYLIGVHSSLLPKVMKMEIGDAVIVDADNNTVHTTHTDFQDIPEDVAAFLKKCLRPEKLKNSMMESGDAISKAFLQALVRLIGGYRDALRFRHGEPITFDPDLFVVSRSQSMQRFLENMLQLQIFQQFINGRLDMLNTGYGFSDTFEQMSMLYADKLNTQSRYKEWQNQMKKQGKKLQKGGKDMWSDLKEKAAPMMTTAVQSVKSHSKKAYSDIKARINEMNERGQSPKNSPSSIPPMGRDINRSRPTTIVGPEISKQRVRRDPPIPAPRNLAKTPVELDIPFVDTDKNHAKTTLTKSHSSSVITDNKIGVSSAGNIPPPRPPKPKMYQNVVEEGPLISFEDDKPKQSVVSFNSEEKQNDLLFSLSQQKQSPQASGLVRKTAFRQSDRSARIQSYKANIYNQTEGNAADLFDPLAKTNCDKDLPKVEASCDNQDLLGDFFSDSVPPKTKTNMNFDAFGMLATPPVMRQTPHLLDNSLQSSSSGSSRSSEDLYSSTSLEGERSAISYENLLDTSCTFTTSDRKSTWQTFD